MKKDQYLKMLKKHFINKKIFEKVCGGLSLKKQTLGSNWSISKKPKNENNNFSHVFSFIEFRNGKKFVSEYFSDGSRRIIEED